MRLILLGPPGSGKGTQAQLLSLRNNLEHIGTGDILRAAMRQGTPAGLRAAPFVDAGQLVPDELVNDLIAEHFRRRERPDCFVLDGYPRTLAQAHALDGVLSERTIALTGVVLLDVPDEEIVRRLAGRWSCPRPGCMRTYHTESRPPRTAGVCDVDGVELIQRSDDHEETVRARLLVYHRNIAELIPYYKGQGLLHEVPAAGPIEEVYNHIKAAFARQAGPSC